MPVSRRRKRQVVVSDADVFLPDSGEVSKWEWRSRMTQPFVLVLFMLRLFQFGDGFLWWEDLLFWGGTALGLFSQVRIMLPTRFTNRRRLFTGDVFKFTRHPMYTGMVIADLSFWRGNLLNPNFISTALLFYGTMLTVGWFHEQEILAKFGPAAERYFARTPRLFFLYPFINKE